MTRKVARRWCTNIYHLINNSFLHVFCRLLIFFSKKIIRVANSLDPDQSRHFVGPDLGPNCLHRLSVDDTIGKDYGLYMVHQPTTSSSYSCVNTTEREYTHAVMCIEL